MTDTTATWIDAPPAADLPADPSTRAFDAVPDDRLDRPIWNLIEERAARDPARVIVDDGVTQLTYAEFVRRVRLLVRQLRAEVPLDRPVALLLRNDAQFAILTMATIAAGLVTVSLDAASATERKALLIAESGAGAIVVGHEEDYDSAFVPEGVRVVRPCAEGQDAGPPPSADFDPQAPAFIGFTSGSTGRAKGIVYAGAQLTRIVAEHIAFHRINRDDVILGIGSHTAAGIREAIVTLLTGALLRPLDFKGVGLMEGLRVMREERVTFLSFIPSYLRMIMQVPGIEECFAHLRVLELGGEVTTPEDVALFRAKLPADCRISLAFGSTETGVMFRWYVDDGKLGAVAPLGYLAPNRTIAILDEHDRPVMPGEAGEMVVSDAMLSHGYWRSGALDPGRFAAQVGAPGPRTFRSGDRIRMRLDGLAEFAGRVDRMVKVNGMQADLGEIEAALRDVDGVADAAVVSPHAEGEGARLVAFVVPREGAVADEAVLRASVARDAAEHMVPHLIRSVDALPRLHNGKPDLVRLTALAKDMV